MARRGLGFAVVAVLASLAPAAAQTTDSLFRSWEADAEPTSVRAASLAGAIVAAPADGATALLHPAGLSLVSEASVSVSARYAGAGWVALDGTAARWSPGEVTLAIPLGLNWGVGAYFRETRQLALQIEPVPLPDGSIDVGELNTTWREAGLAAGYALRPRWRIGFRLGLADTRLDGTAITSSSEGTDRSLTASLDHRQVRLAAGVLFAPEQRFQAGVTWESRLRGDGRLAATDGDVAWRLSDASRLGLGVVYRPSSVVSFLLQADVVDWSGVHDALDATPGRPTPDEFTLQDATEVRAGLELLPHYGDIGVWWRPALRAGWRLRSRGLLRYVGEDPVERARFPGADRSHEFSIGAALGHVEIAWISREPSATWLFGIRHVF